MTDTPVPPAPEAPAVETFDLAAVTTPVTLPPDEAQILRDLFGIPREEP